MKSSRKSRENSVLELHRIGARDRIFQTGRDSFLVYVGLRSGDKRPFVRVGSGEAIYSEILPHIAHVILPSSEELDIGQELAWLSAALREKLDDIGYIGHPDKMKEVYRIARSQHQPKQNHSGYYAADMHTNPVPMELDPIGPPSLSLGKDRATVHIMKNGNFVILVGTSRVFDLHNMQKRQLGIEQEYAMIHHALKKRPDLRMGSRAKRSFLWLGEEYSPGPHQPFLYWNFQSKGALVNPCQNPHYALFEERIDPERVQALLGHSALDAGFTEVLRHKNAKKQSLSLYSAEENIAKSLKRLYENSNYQYIYDGSAIPFLEGHALFSSRSRSHAAFSWRLEEGQDKITQILFPIAKAPIRRSFDMIRAPHDVEIQAIDKREDLQAGMAHIALQIPASPSPSFFARLRLRKHRYPLLPHTEYVFHEALENTSLVGDFLDALDDMPGYSFLYNFMLFHMKTEADSLSIRKGLRRLQRQLKLLTKDAAHRHNMGVYCRFLQTLPAYASYAPSHKRLLRRIYLRSHPSWISYKTWLALGKKGLVCHLYLCGGRQSFLLAKRLPAPLLSYTAPPPTEELAKEPRAYSYKLRLWEKILDRSDANTAQAFLPSLIFLEKLYKEKLRFLEERQRLAAFTKALRLKTPSASHFMEDSEEFLAWSEKLQQQRKRLLSLIPFRNFFAKDRWEAGRQNMGEALNFALRAAPVVVIASLLFFGASQLLSYLSNNVSAAGDSKAEITAAALAPPGSMQLQGEVPGEGKVSPSTAELAQYAAVLAERNGFRGLSSRSTAEQLRDPDLVFPGDTLRLPDGRLTKINKGEYIWELARIHYRKDFARLQILQRQIYARMKAGQIEAKDLPLAARRELRYRQRLMKRLAVTKLMRALVQETNRRIQGRS